MQHISPPTTIYDHFFQEVGPQWSFLHLISIYMSDKLEVFDA